MINQDPCSFIVIVLDWAFAATAAIPGSISVYSCADQVLNACRFGLAVIDRFTFFVVVFAVVLIGVFICCTSTSVHSPFACDVWPLVASALNELTGLVRHVRVCPLLELGVGCASFTKEPASY